MLNHDEPAEQLRSPLDHRKYRELWLANVASNFGSQVQVVGAGWLMSSLTSSPRMIAFVQTATSLATVFFILAGGALADTVDRRRMMLATQTMMLVVAGIMAVLTWQGLIAPASLLLMTFVLSALSSINNPAWQASVRNILPRALISQAVALNSTSINLARTVGPALGGFIVAAAGAGAAFIANAFSFVAFLLALLRWHPSTAVRSAPRERIGPAMWGGIRYVSLAPHIRNAALRGAMSGISASAMFSLLPVVARQEMGGNAALYGFLLAAFGLGAVSSAMAGAALRARLTPDQVTRIGSVALTTGLALLALAPSPVLAALGAVLGGGGWTLAHSTFNTTVQLSAPAWVTARALALYQTATFAGMALGSVLFGSIAEAWTVAAALLAASLAQGVSGLVGLLMPLPRYEDLKVEPLHRERDRTQDDVHVDEGPIQIALVYRVTPGNEIAFYEAMAERGRIRRRDGARDWALWQDLGDRAQWAEVYQVSTWAEYERHLGRRTTADKASFDAVLRLTEDCDGPTVRRLVRKRT